MTAGKPSQIHTNFDGSRSQTPSDIFRTMRTGRLGRTHLRLRTIATSQPRTKFVAAVWTFGPLILCCSNV